MIWFRPVCAACARPVAEGRCPTCRAARTQLQAVPAALLAAIALLLALLTALLTGLALGDALPST